MHSQLCRLELRARCARSALHVLRYIDSRFFRGGSWISGDVRPNVRWCSAPHVRNWSNGRRLNSFEGVHGIARPSSFRLKTPLEEGVEEPSGMGLPGFKPFYVLDS